MSTTTFVTTHSIDGAERDALAEDEQHRRFADYVASNQPRLLDFQAFINEENTVVKLQFVFPDAAEDDAAPAGRDRTYRALRDSGWAAVLAAATIVVLLFAAVSIGFGGSPTAA